MNTPFNHTFALLTDNGASSTPIKGIMREDGTAAILSPDCKTQLEQATRLHYFLSPQETVEFEIKNYYLDILRPIGKRCTKPIVVQLTRFVGK
ncbi:MAG: hypothetical protein ACR2PU_02300 [Gammaproteobacteria bacterium]